MKAKEFWTFEEWRDYYRKKAQANFDLYQEIGDRKHYREYIKYDAITQAFCDAIDHRSDEDATRMRRAKNISAYLELHPIGDTMTGEEVRKMINDIRNM